MKNIINLSIIYFKQTLSQFFRSKKRTSTLSNTLFMLAIFVIVMLAMGFAYMGSAEQFSAIGHPEYVLVIGLMLSAFLVLMMTVYDSQNQYYKNKDYDLLASLPIKNYSIITAKYLSSYFVSFFYGLLIAFPAYVVYFIVCPLNIVAIIYSILSLFFIPTFTQLVGSILAYCQLDNLQDDKQKDCIKYFDGRIDYWTYCLHLHWQQQSYAGPFYWWLPAVDKDCISSYIPII